jgi:hypothetical protein
MTEREEFELVAKAAGYEYKFVNDPPWGVGHRICIKDFWYDWNPKTDDGDSRRLAVDLNIVPWLYTTGVEAIARLEGEAGRRGSRIEISSRFSEHPDKYAAVRAAVWDVAVEVAKRRMKK